ncbi:MAG: hypothetical protein ACI4KM_10310 [Oscillospiraceae bacterium]
MGATRFSGYDKDRTKQIAQIITPIIGHWYISFISELLKTCLSIYLSEWIFAGLLFTAALVSIFSTSLKYVA